MKIGLFFGSFNPIHNGHIKIAHSMLEMTTLDEIWFIVSPVSPFKEDSDMISERYRFDLVKAATQGVEKFEASDIEFDMPKPSYTYDTLQLLSKKHSEHHFTVIIGEDNLADFRMWKNAEEILADYNLCVYPRPGGSPDEWKSVNSVTFLQAPEMDISATMIRKEIRNGGSLKYLLPNSVEAIIKNKKLYL